MRNRRRLLLLGLLLIAIAVPVGVYFTRGPKRLGDLPEPERTSDVKPFTIPTDDKRDLIEPQPIVPKPLLPAIVPTISPSQQLGDRKYLGPHPYGLMAASRDGAIAAYTEPGNPWVLAIWNTASGRVIRQSADPASGGSIALTHDGSTLFAGHQSRDPITPACPLRVWDLRSGKLLRERMTGFWALSADEKTLVTVDVKVDIDPMHSGRRHAEPTQSTLAVWDLETWKMRRAFIYRNFHPNAIALSPDGSKVVGTNGGSLVAFDTNTGKALWGGNGERAGISALLFSPDGKTVASAEERGSPPRHVLRVWDVTTGTSRFLSSDRGIPLNIGWGLLGWGYTPDSAKIFIGTAHAAVAVDVAAGELPPGDLTLQSGQAEFARHGIRPDGTEFLTAFGLSGDGKTAFLGGRFVNGMCGLRVVDVATQSVRFPPNKLEQLADPFPLAPMFPGWQRRPDLRNGSPEQIELPDKRRLTWFYASAEGKVRLDDPNGKRIRLFGHNQVDRYTITPDAESVATSGYAVVGANHVPDTTMAFWDLETGKAWGTIPLNQKQGYPGGRIRMSPDGRTFVVSHVEDGGIWLWEVATLKPRLRLDPVGPSIVEDLVFSHTGRRILSTD